MNDLEKILKTINELRDDKKITAEDAKVIKNFAESLATKSGNFGAAKRERIEEKIDNIIKSNSSVTETDEEDDEDNTPPKLNKRDKPKKIDIPKPNKRAKITLPKDSDDRIQMPDINKKVLEEVERVTIRLIKNTKEFIEGGQNFYGIDYLAENEILDDDGQPYYVLPDYNSPGGYNGAAGLRIDEIKKSIENLLKKSRKYGQRNPKTDQYTVNETYDYESYLKLFDIRYNGVGDPSYRFTLSLSGISSDDLTVLLVEESPDIT